MNIFFSIHRSELVPVLDTINPTVRTDIIDEYTKRQLLNGIIFCKYNDPYIAINKCVVVINPQPKNVLLWTLDL